MSIASEITRINHNISTAYSACLDKGAAMPQTQNSANLADTISTIQEGAATLEKKDVNFYDYDGALLYSYTAQETQALSELPPLPMRSGLIAQEWNWTLADIQSHLSTGQVINVGCTYDTDDGSTRFYLQIKKGTRIPTLSVTVRMDSKKTATVDWGDGTSSVLDNPSSSWTYVSAVKTDYVEATEDTELCVRISEGSFTLPDSIFSGGDIPILTRANVGSNCTGITGMAFKSLFQLSAVSLADTVRVLGIGAFQYCSNLRSLTIPSGTRVINNNCFENCFVLRMVSVPSSVIQFGMAVFGNCYSLESMMFPTGFSILSTAAFSSCRSLTSISFPTGIHTIVNNVCNSCYSLRTVTIPDNITAIDHSVFHTCYSLTHIKLPGSLTQIGTSSFANARLYEMDLTDFTDPLAVPVLNNTSAFANTPAYMKITVANQEMLSAFSSATNWSTYANRMQIKGASA